MTEKNPSGLTSETQGSVVPLGWKPTASEPVPVVRCVQVKKDGTRCKQWSLRGTVKCYAHGGRGNFKNVEKYRQAVIEAARLQLVDASPDLIQSLLDMTDPASGTADQIRLKAITEAMDRAGIKGGFEITVDAEVSINSAETVQERLAKLAQGAAAVKKMRDEDMDIVEAEVVEDDNQPTLFDLGEASE